MSNLFLTLVLITASVIITFKIFPEASFNTVDLAFRFIRDQGFRFVSPKHYENDPEGYVPLPFTTVLNNIKTDLVEKEGVWELNCSYNGEIRTTRIYLANGFDPNKPSLVFHHSAGETNYKFAFDVVFGKTFYERFNIFLIKAQKHGSKKEYFSEAADSFLHHQQTFAGSVLAVEEIVKYHKENSDKPIYVTGTSMGGVVSSLHAFHFGTADKYFPLVGYPNVGELFLGPAYKNGVANWEEKRKNEAYLNSYKIDESKAEQLRSKVFPILGEKDVVVRFEEAGKFWKNLGFNVVSYPYGHFTPAIKRYDIRSYILSFN